MQLKCNRLGLLFSHQTFPHTIYCWRSNRGNLHAPCPALNCLLHWGQQISEHVKRLPRILAAVRIHMATAAAALQLQHAPARLLSTSICLRPQHTCHDSSHECALAAAVPAAPFICRLTSWMPSPAAAAAALPDSAALCTAAVTCEVAAEATSFVFSATTAATSLACSSVNSRQVGCSLM